MPLSVRIFVILAALVFCQVLTAPAQTLRQAAAERGIVMGAAAGYSNLTQTDFTTVLAREFSQLQPENDMKWDTIHPAPNTYAFRNGDGLVAFAAANNMKVRGHVLVWHNQNPSWLTGGNFTSTQLSQILQDHITNVLNHYAGKVYAWDVVNEAFNDNGTLRSTIWYNSPGLGLSGAGYIEQAFRWARGADSQALLFYNDFSAEATNAKSDAIYAMVKDFRARGVPIDGVGLQMHLTLQGVSATSVAANIKRLTDLGLLVQITELDVRVPVDTNGQATPADLATEAQIYKTAATVCLQNPRCTALQTWGFTDKYSWIPGSFPGFGAALPLDANYQPKSAYSAIQSAMATTPPVLDATGIVNAASYKGGALAPGELITLFGPSFGPAELVGLVLDAGGRVSTNLSNTRVLFDGLPAPIIYSKVNQVSAIVPFGLTGKSSTQVQYEYKGIGSNTVTALVAASAPGIFSMDASGSGPGAILNQDSSGNSASNPASAGDVIQLYATGGGTSLTPRPSDGELTQPPFPQLTGVSVMIGGRNSEIVYAGSAPFLVAGVLQINIRIPPGTPRGSSPVILTIAGVPSQTNATVAVR